MKPLVLLFGLFSGICGTISGASLSIATQTASPGGSVVTSVSLSGGGKDISGLQFDLQWDNGLSVQVAGGPQLGNAYKVLYTASGTQTLRCMIVGFNQASIADGAVINVFVSVDPAASVGTAQIHLVNAVATSPAGASIALGATAAGIQIQAGSAQLLTANSVLNAASLAPGPIAPGEIVTLLGSFSGASPVSVNNASAPLLYAGTSQVNAIVPFGMSLTGPAAVQLGGLASVPIPVAPVAPALFTVNGGGNGPGAILNQDYSPNSLSNPAARGSVVMLFGAGFGVLTPPVADGQTVAGASSVASVTATVGGLPASVTYAGAAPGLIAGLYQINVQIPAALAPGLATPVVLAIGSQSTQTGVTVSVK